MKTFHIVANAFSAGLLCVLSFHLAAGDVLLFSSDFISLSLYLGAASAVIGAVFAAVICLVGFLPGRRYDRGVYTSALLAVFFVIAFLAAGSTLIHPGLRALGLGDWVTWAAQAVDGFWLLFPAGLAFAMATGWFFRANLRMIEGQQDMAPRINQLGLLVFAAGILASGFTYLQAPISGPTAKADTPSRHLVLMVIDRMPSWAFGAYNPAAEPTSFDLDLKERVRVFHNMQSSQPYTHGFFGTLYRGRLPGDAAKGNVLGRLSTEGVDINLMYDHRAAAPEGSSAQVSSYNGLRSRLLGPESAAIPRALGVQHHITLVPPRPNEGIFLAPLWKALNPGHPGADVLNEVLLPSIETSTARSNQSFTLFHISLSRFNTKSYAERSPQFAAKGEDPIITTARTNGYRYQPGPEADAVVQQYHDFVAEDVRHFAASFQSFLEKLEAGSPDRNVTFVVTSDHGIIYDKGRLFYGYHPQREVVRVPLFLFGRQQAGQQAGQDHRTFGTMDLSHTLLDFFDVAEPPLTDGVASLLGDKAGGTAATLTLKSDYQKEWFFVFYQDDEVIRINVHPEADLQIEALRYDRFEESPVTLTEEKRQDILAQARQWMKRFRIELKATNIPVR